MDADAVSIADAVRARRISTRDVIEATLQSVEQRNPTINALTGQCVERARARARSIDTAIAAGEGVGPLAGVPFVVKAQIAVAGLTTTAGSKLHANDPPATRDAASVAALERAGAICIGVANMDEFGMGGTTENRHFGATRNPHDVARTPGGSSGGSAAAVAAGLVPIALGTDALGSIRLPAALCGVYGLRPTYGSISGEGVKPSPGSITTVGPLARTVDDLEACFAALSGRAGPDRRSAHADDVSTMNVGVAGGYFARNLDGDGVEALAIARRAFRKAVDVEFPEAARARAANALVNASESAGPQLDRLRRNPDDFDPMTRDRFLAHALLPVAWYLRAQRFRRWHRTVVLRLLEVHPVLMFPATPCVAPPIGTPTLRIDGVDQPTGPSLGLYAQPLAGLGLPVLTVPIHRPGRLPAGVQLLAAPDRESLLFTVAAYLEARGIARAPVARDEAPRSS